MTTPKIEPTPEIRYKKIFPDAELPFRATTNAIGLDISAYLINSSGRNVNFILPPRDTRIVSTGLILLPPEGYFLSVCSRSGLAKDSIWVANAPGIIDPDYTGELKVLLYNGGHQSALLKHGDRIAQIIPVRIPSYLRLSEIDILPTTDRGDRGFGSTGTKPVSTQNES